MDNEYGSSLVGRFVLELGKYSGMAYIIHILDNNEGMCGHNGYYYYGNKCSRCKLPFPNHLIIQRDLLNGKDA